MEHDSQQHGDGFYHKKSSSQLPPNLNNALKGQKRKTIQKQNLLRQMQLNTGFLVQGSKRLDSPMSPYPNGYGQRNKLEPAIKNSKRVEIFQFEMKNQNQEVYSTPQKKLNLYGSHTQQIKSTKFDHVQKSTENDDLQGLISNATMHRRNSLSKNEFPNSQIPQKKIQTGKQQQTQNFAKTVFPVIQLNSTQMQYNYQYSNILIQDSPATGVYDQKKRVIQNRKSENFKGQEISTIQSKMVSDLKQERDYEDSGFNQHKIQKLQFAKNTSKQISQLTSLVPSSVQLPQSEFSQYCDSLNIKKKVIKKSQIEFANEENARTVSMTEDNIHMRNFDYHQGISHSQSQEQIKEQIHLVNESLNRTTIYHLDQKPPPTQIRFRDGLNPPSTLDNFTVEQLTHIKNLIARKENNEIIQQVSSIIKTQEIYDKMTQQTPVGYTIKQRFATQKYYDRKKMIDFYKSIKIEDTKQAIAQAPPSNPLKLRFSIFSGNNSRLVKLAFQTRNYFWEETTNQDPHFHFRWTQVSSSVKFENVGKDIQSEFHPCQKQMVNHYEGHGCLSEKSKLFLNMSRYSGEKLNENVFDYLPLTFFVEVDRNRNSREMVKYMNAFYALDDVKKRTRRYYDKRDGKVDPEEEGEQNTGEKEILLDDPYIFKHFYQNKICLIKQHKKEEREERARVQQEAQSEQKKILKKYFYRQSIPFCHYSGYNMWILKATKLNQGQGIHVCNTLPQIKTLIEKYCTGFPKKENESFTMEKDVKAMQLQKQKSEQPRKAQLVKSKLSFRGKSEMKIKVSDDDISSIERATSNRSQDKVKTQIETINEEFSDDERQNSPQKSAKKKVQVPEKQKDDVKLPLKDGEPKYKHNSFIIQKYIERPLLVKQRKFDIRIWVLINPQGEVYLCQKGYLRTSSYKFNIDPEDPDNRFVHLTNIAVQKYCEQFGQHEDGNILSTNQFQENINQTYPSKNYSIENDLMVTVKQQIARTLFASRKRLDPQKRNQSQNGRFFELFGYDFMIDEDFNVWLIEVNTNPSLAESSQYLKELVPRMIDDLIKITVDKEFYEYYCFIASQSGQDSQYVDKYLKDIKSHKLRDFPDNKNIWEKFISLQNKQQRREDKNKYLNPIIINSQYAFQIKGREFRIKKYVQFKPNKQ